METLEALQVAQSNAQLMLVEQFDDKRGIPMRASSHTDLWPGDRWPEAYIAAGLPDMAEASMEAIARSQRSNMLFPHLMQGSHVRAGIETRWIDRQIYRAQGNGAEQLPNGEWVTTSIAPPTQALSALAIVKAGLRLPESITVASLLHSTEVLRDRRICEPASTLLRAENVDELTSSKGDLADELKMQKKAADPAINALYYRNELALIEFAQTAGFVFRRFEKPGSGSFAAQSLHVMLNRKQQREEELSREEVLAIARLGFDDLTLDNDTLRASYYPDTTTHPERTQLTLAERIEIARLTPYAEASRDYLSTVLTVVAYAGQSALTRYQDAAPGKNALANKYNRKQIWLPTAAEVVQITPDQL